MISRIDMAKIDSCHFDFTYQIIVKMIVKCGADFDSDFDSGNWGAHLIDQIN